MYYLKTRPTADAIKFRVDPSVMNHVLMLLSLVLLLGGALLYLGNHMLYFPCLIKIYFIFAIKKVITISHVYRFPFFSSLIQFNFKRLSPRFLER